MSDKEDLLGQLGTIALGLNVDEMAVLIQCAESLAMLRAHPRPLHLASDRRNFRAEAAAAAIESVVLLACDQVREDIARTKGD